MSSIIGAKRDHPDEDNEEISNKKSRVEEKNEDDEAEPQENDIEAINLVKSAPKVKTRTLETIQTVENKSCTHEVAIPLEQDYIPLKPATGEPAKTYDFTLDPFQVRTYTTYLHTELRKEVHKVTEVHYI